MKAFSLVELLISMVILAIILLSAAQVFSHTYYSYQRAIALYKIQADYVSLLWNFKTRIAGAKEISNVSLYPTLASRIDLQEYNVYPTAPAAITGNDYLNASNFITRSFQLAAPISGRTGGTFSVTMPTWSDRQVRYFADATNTAAYSTIAKETLYTYNIFRPNSPGPDANNYNDCFFGLEMRSPVTPKAPTTTDVFFKSIMRFTTRCRRAGI